MKKPEIASSAMSSGCKVTFADEHKGWVRPALGGLRPLTGLAPLADQAGGGLKQVTCFAKALLRAFVPSRTKPGGLKPRRAHIQSILPTPGSPR